MIRVCVIGNSHVATIKEGWDKIASARPDISLTFFASRRRRILELVADNGKLQPGNSDLMSEISITSGGKTSVDPDEYDVFLIYGLNNFWGNGDLKVRYSQAVWRAWLGDKERNSPAFFVAGLLREITDKPLYMGHNPMKAFAPDDRPVSVLTYDEHIAFLNDEVYQTLPATMIGQPTETICYGVATERKYAIGSKRLKVGFVDDMKNHDEGDIGHMNADFGQLWLEAFLKALKPTA